MTDDYNSDDEKFLANKTNLPWWKFNTASSTMMVWDSFFALVILTNIILIPISICFAENFHESSEPDIDWTTFGMFMNGLWAMYFFLRINRVDYARKNVVFYDTMMAYLKSPFLIPDLIILISSSLCIIIGNHQAARFIELFRIFHFKEALYPINLCVRTFTNNGQKRISQIQNLIFIFFMFIVLGHLAACLWIFMGKWDENLPPEERESWLYVNDFNFMDDNDTTPLSSATATYIFSIYWVFTTLTTVGYGDYSGGTSREYIVTLVFEFVGFCYNAVLISVMSSFFASETTFDDLLNVRLNEMVLWLKRIELSKKPEWLHPLLGKKIQDTVRDAFHYDFNLIVEEYVLYQQLTPKMQTELISLIFGRFMNRFKHFFNSCEQGFRNEFVIWLYARVHMPNSEV